MISEEYYVFNIKTCKKLFGTFNKNDAIKFAKNMSKENPKEEYQVNRIITYIDSIFNNKHNE